MDQTPGNRPRVSILILNWNGAAMLRRFLPEVVANTSLDDAKIIVVDNGSNDNSMETASRFSCVETIRLDRNYGYAEGYNRAMAQIDTEYSVLLNSDVAPCHGWLRPLLEFMDSNPDVAACQPKILSVDDPTKFEYAGACGGFLDRHGYPYCRGRVFSTIETDNGQYDTPIDIDWASGAALMVRTSLYREAGGLDPRFFAHMEEIDLCWRLRNKGYRVSVVPASTVLHVGGGSLPASNPRKTYLNFRNGLLLLHKNMPAAHRSSTLLKRRLLDTLAWGKFIISGKWKHASAILRAHADFRKMRRFYDDITNTTTSETGTSANTANPLASRPDIVTGYYMKGRHTFDRL